MTHPINPVLVPAVSVQGGILSYLGVLCLFIRLLFGCFSIITPALSASFLGARNRRMAACAVVVLVAVARGLAGVALNKPFIATIKK